jgi:hypothetical protein
MLDRKRNTRSRYTMAECLLLQQLSVRYPTNIDHGRSRILEAVHHWLSIASKYYV